MSLDIVIPAHNEEGRIGRTLAAYRDAFDRADVRLHVAMDACSDGTAQVVAGHAQQDPRIRRYHYPKLGKGGVIAETFRHCQASHIAFVDADCATPPKELARLVTAVADADGAIASRRMPAAVLPRRRPLSRRVTSAGFAFGVRHLFDLPYGDTQCGAKVFTRALVARSLPLLSSRDFVFDVDLLVIARALGARIREVPTVWIDRDGSHVDPVADTRRMAASLIRLWLHHRVMPVGPQDVPRPDADGDVVIDLTRVRGAALAAS